MPPPWLLYEVAARTILEQIGNALGITTVEGKQLLDGESGTEWEIDARAFQEDSANFLVVEVRRYTTTSLKQQGIAALAYRISDIGAAGGIVVSPLPLQSGAALVAKAAGIEHVRLTPDSTATDYLAHYMGRRFIGASIVETVTATDFMDAEISRPGKNHA
jgi:hypothetical protein